MKRLLALVTVAGLLVPGASTAAPGVKRQQQADAIWMVPTETKGRFIGYYASVHLDEPSGGMFWGDDASIGKGRCTRRKTGFGTMTSCVFRSSAHGKASESFSMDPLMQSAELELEHKGKTYTIAWEGRDPGLYQAAEGCFSVNEDGEEEEGQGSGGGMLRRATATGHIFGEHLVSTGSYDAMMLSGVMVTECTRFEELSRLRPGQRLRVTF